MSDRDTSFDLFLDALSEERLRPYRCSDKGDVSDALAKYVWNIQLSESLYPALQSLEIALRNSIHKAAEREFGNPFWMMESQVLLERELKTVTKARKSLISRQKSITPGQLVAELSFGFWTALFDTRYEKKLWPKLTKNVFTDSPRSLRSRMYIQPRLQKARKLRNRVFHHEPIWHWQDLTGQYTELLEVIYWISPTVHRTVIAIERFPEIHSQGYESCLESVSSVLKDK